MIFRPANVYFELKEYLHVWNHLSIEFYRGFNSWTFWFVVKEYWSECIGGLWPRLWCIWYDWTFPWVMPITFPIYRYMGLNKVHKYHCQFAYKYPHNLFLLHILAVSPCLCCQKDKQQECMFWYLFCNPFLEKIW